LPDVSAASERTRHTLPARLRVKRAGLFQEAFSQGRKHAGNLLVLWSRAGEDANRRLGVVASRKVGNSVARSQAKRYLRELFRLNRHRILGDEDVILVARHRILSASPAERLRDFESVFSRAGRLQTSASLHTTPIQPEPKPLSAS